MRVSAKAPYGAKASHKLSPATITNLHWAVANQKEYVFYSTNNQIDIKKINGIKKYSYLGTVWKSSSYALLMLKESKEEMSLGFLMML